MSRWMRFLVAMVLAVALPLQGAAAARLQHCNSSSTVSAAIERVAEHETMAQASSPHAHHHDSAHEAADGLTTRSHDPVKQSLTGEAKCSACAACCAGAAIPVLPIPFGDAELGETHFSHGRTPAPVFLTEGLERPPRIFNAG